MSVPITWAYNHHYVSYLVGKKGSLVKTTGKNLGLNHGAMHYYEIKSASPPPAADSDPNEIIPDASFFSEGNGGEYRKSFHGYPPGMAQLINSPESFSIEPMQSINPLPDTPIHFINTLTLPAVNTQILLSCLQSILITATTTAPISRQDCCPAHPAHLQMPLTLACWNVPARRVP